MLVNWVRVNAPISSLNHPPKQQGRFRALTTASKSKRDGRALTLPALGHLCGTDPCQVALLTKLCLIFTAGRPGEPLAQGRGLIDSDQMHIPTRCKRCDQNSCTPSRRIPYEHSARFSGNTGDMNTYQKCYSPIVCQLCRATLAPSRNVEKLLALFSR